jgi:type IV pilus assembly protein PilF
MKALRLGLMSLGLLLLAACASQPAGDTTPPPAQRKAPTESDVQRRAEVRLELAALYFSRGQSQTALEELRQAMALRPEWAEAFGMQGLIQAAQGDLAAAEASFKRALGIAPGDGDVLHNYGWFLCQQRRFAESDAQFELAVLNPRYRDVARSLLAQGVCRARDQRWAEAEKSLARSYELDPANPATAFNLAEVLLRRGELERARFYTRRINQQAEQVSAQSLWLAARIERRIGNAEGLQDFARQLRDRFPQSPEALQLERGRFDE